MTVEQALRALLVGSGLSLQHVGGDNFVVVEGVDPNASQPPPAAPEILVVGRRTQNADIRRSANDVQPYQVLTRREVLAAHVQTVEELLAKRITPNALGLSLAQAPISGGGFVRSSIDLRGLGTDQTLVLIDGRRMPRLPTSMFTLLQPDVNALSPESIERAETITSTAGGIYGPGAVAGVINLVLRRDYRGAEISATRGISARGDGGYGRLDVRAGFTPDQGDTDVMVAYSRSVSDGLENGDRDFQERGRALRFANVKNYGFTELPESNSVNITSLNRMPLILKPAFGGMALGSTLTSLPSGSYPSTAAVGAALAGHAGALDLSLAPGVIGRQGSLVSGRRTESILANVRHSFGDGTVRAYADYIRLVDDGRFAYALPGNVGYLDASDPRNPFQQTIGFSFPTPGFGSTGRTRVVDTRLSLGGIFNISADWKANVDYSVGQGRQTSSLVGTSYGIDGYLALNGLPRPGRAALDFFGNTTDFLNALATYTVPTSASSSQTNRLRDATLRLAGPAAKLPGGLLDVTVLMEERYEAVRTSEANSVSAPFAVPSSQTLLGHTERVRSAYVELRAPLIKADSAVAPLRGLEVQLALRGDRTKVTIANDPYEVAFYDRFRSAERSALLFTAGAKVRPVPGLLLRASLATGELTPPLSALANSRVLGEDGPDPRRGNGRIPSYELVVFGDGKIIPERASSFSAGLVGTPFGSDGATMTIDYTRIRRSREIDSRFIGSAYYFLRNEALYPGRITRQPLTQEDAALGYTGGVITRIDATYLNIGWTVVEAVDARFEIPFHTGRTGDFLLRGAVTWQPRYRKFKLPGDPTDSLVDYIDGALSWRGNGGVGWSRGPIQLSFTGQYYGGYRIIYGTRPQVSNPSIGASQGSDRTGAAATFDLAAAYRFTVARDGSKVRTIDLRFGIQDLLDRRPATVLSAGGDYSVYDDPRRRRFELTATVGF